MLNVSITPPTAISAFSCLAVNIMGPGIIDSGNGENSTTPDSSILAALYAGTSSCGYAGITSPGIPLTGGNQSVTLTVPAGPSRVVQVGGVVDPAGVVCNAGIPVGSINTPSGSNVGFFELGRAVVDLFSSQSVQISSDWDAQTAANQLSRRIDCDQGSNGSNSQTLVPDGTALNGRIFHDVSAGTCVDLVGTIPASTTPTLTAFTETSTYADLTNEEGDCGTNPSHCIRTQCNIPTAGGFLDATYVVWDLSSINLTQYLHFQTHWAGRSGHYSGVCDGVTTALGNGQSAPANTVQLFEASSGIWQTILLTTAGVGDDVIDQGGTLSTYIDANKKFWMRIVSDSPSSTPYCATVQTDSVRLIVTN